MTWRDVVPFRKRSIPVRRGADNPFDRLRDEMDTLFEDFFRDFPLDPYGGHHAKTFIPNVDISESDKEIKIAAELPGMDDKDIDVTINRDSLTIKGEKKEEKEAREKDYYHMERSYGSFSRTIPLPVEVESDKAKAQFKKGVLTITFPKTAKTIDSKRKIAITAE